MADLIGAIAIAGWLFIGWWAWGRLARRLGTGRWQLIGWVALIDRIFRR